MKLSRLNFTVILVGIISSAVLIYFYMMQRDFTKNHREFLISINNFENTQSDLSYIILENSLYAYNNQDQISLEIKKLLEEYENLKKSTILLNKNYNPIQENLTKLKQKLTLDLENIDEYLMLNAGIKNSLIFLTRHLDDSNALNADSDTFLKANQILKHFNDAVKMQDLDYITNLHVLTVSDLQSSDTINFIHTFNMHADYLIQKYPLFIEATQAVTHSNIHELIKKIRDDFSTLALNDFKALDIFALIVFSVYIVSLFIIVSLFVKNSHENKKLQETKKSLEYSLTYDMLTGLYNRKALEAELSQIDFPHVLILDINGFKDINDVYGNDVGNTLLKDLATFLKNSRTDIHDFKIYRLGGDEFAILFDDINKDVAFNIAIKLEKNISEHIFAIDELRLNLTVSIASNNITPILENADLALKLIKKEHRKHVIAYKESLNLKKSVQENLDTLKLIKDAVSNDKIVPFFQPIVNLQTAKIEKYEALVRLKLPDGTFLPPIKFLDTSKKTSYYHEITKIMIEKTIKVAGQFPKYRFSLNISMQDILDQEITDMLLQSLRLNPLISSRIDIELLEVEHLENLEMVQEFIKELHKFGSKILIDDFGSGYSNFSYFSDLDIDIVKIDGSIVREITTNNRKLHMLRSIHKFSHGMDMQSVAEFVETKESAMLLKEIGIEYGQGYYFSKPLQMPLDSDDVII
ncbi:MAG: EAL domain-containing protein [Campylobacterales bacterium]|nr:EAL domain-containing protein [Campylobacterales bacterium]